MDFYLIAVIILLALAVSDLMVGVSNDAVNFLNSAIGSKVGSRTLILIVASLGIFVGATFSSGMMEIARKGIFDPQQFVFFEIMVIFLAVMLTDVIMLDLFNTFGMPTSTTVSIVFELLGAAVAVALIKVTGAGEGLAALGTYINTATALAIISGILLSVVVAFTVGVIVQYVSRLLFSFRYERRMKSVGLVWSALALTAMSYFLIIKGMKGASFVSESFIAWVDTHTLLLIGGFFVAWLLIAQGLTMAKVNILRFVVFVGTFALAMAFAGNDLVNFIGVPIAGLESYMTWSGTGIAEDQYAMTALAEPVRTPTGLLLLAGLIMVATLWLSKKARSVTETEVNLGRQSEGLERFTPNIAARFIVRASRSTGQVVRSVLPDAWLRRAETNFAEPTVHASADPDRPAFDLVRASVNLTVASMLIALATSLQLPLSTTYVSFMVAMGASLSDRAWGRDSAVYRVSGVLSVIGGWFLTAIIAFTVASIFAFLLYHFGGIALTGLVALAAFSVFRGIVIHRRREARKEKLERAERQLRPLTLPAALDQVASSAQEILQAVQDLYRSTLSALFEEDLRRLERNRTTLDRLKDDNAVLRQGLHALMQRAQEQPVEVSRLFLIQYDLTHDLLQSTGFIVETSYTHVANSHLPLTERQIERLTGLRDEVSAYFDEVAQRVEAKRFEDLVPALNEKTEILDRLETLHALQVEGVQSDTYGRKNSTLYLRLLVETKDVVAIAARYLKSYRHRAAHASDIEVVV